MKQNNDKPAENNRRYFIKRLLINLSVLAAIGLGLIWVALTWLDVWTDHGHYKTVPSVVGLNYYEASDKLALEGFQVELNDSLYDSSSKPGTVVDQNPRTGTKVKHGREIYLTINSFSPKTVKVPQVIDVSERQAKALLQGVGLKNITVVNVPSDYKGLVVGARSGGRMLTAGMRLPVSASIILEVGEGPSEYSEPDDSTYAPSSADDASLHLDF